MFKFVILTLALLAPATFAVDVLPCDLVIDESYLPVAVRADNCETGTCEVSISSPLRFEVDAIAPYLTTSMTANGMMVFSLPDGNEAEIPIPFPDEIASACTGLVGSTCPISSNAQFTWGINWDWSPDVELIPNTEFQFKFRLYDQDEIPICCFRMPVRLTP